MPFIFQSAHKECRYSTDDGNTRAVQSYPGDLKTSSQAVRRGMEYLLIDNLPKHEGVFKNGTKIRKAKKQKWKV